MFKSLQPMLAERSIHILLNATKDERIAVYVEPVKKNDKEDSAFVTPFRCEATAEELDAQLSTVLSQWLTTRSTVMASLADALAAADAAAKTAVDEAKKKTAERGKKVTAATPVAAKLIPKTAAARPSLFDTDGMEGGIAAPLSATPSFALENSSHPVIESPASAQGLTETTQLSPTVVVPVAAATNHHAAVVTSTNETESLF